MDLSTRCLTWVAHRGRRPHRTANRRGQPRSHLPLRPGPLVKSHYDAIALAGIGWYATTAVARRLAVNARRRVLPSGERPDTDAAVIRRDLYLSGPFPHNARSIIKAGTLHPKRGIVGILIKCCDARPTLLSNHPSGPGGACV